MMEWILVGTGGFVGSIARYGISIASKSFFSNHYPIGTLIVNILGCFLIGILSVTLEKRFSDQPMLFLLLGTGFLGGFTTFSAFGLETLDLVKNQGLVQAALYVGASVTLGLLAVALGRILA